MPRAFLIKSRAACPAPKKENSEDEEILHEKAQATEVNSSFIAQGKVLRIFFENFVVEDT